jgi:hypothetical protein
MNKREAQNHGDALARELGEGWTPRVWENLGWHYSAMSSSDTISVHQTYSNNRYLALAHTSGGSGGQPGLTGQGDTPRKAVEDTIARIRAEIAKLESWLEGVD